MVKVDCVEFTQQYRIIRKIGDGGFSDIFLGTNRHTNNPVAVKMVNLMKYSHSENTLKFLKNESSLLSKLSHVNIIHLLDYFNSNNYIYLVLDYEDNNDLLEYLMHSKGLKNLEVINIYRQIVSSIDYCHNHNICHRDIKPENFLIGRDGWVRLIDFGLAVEVEKDKLISLACGSFSYAAPEVIQCRAYNPYKSDMWGLGILLYVLLTNDVPYDADNKPELLHQYRTRRLLFSPRWAPYYKEILHSLLNFNPRERMDTKGVLEIFPDYDISTIKYLNKKQGLLEGFPNIVKPKKPKNNILYTLLDMSCVLCCCYPQVLSKNTSKSNSELLEFD